MDYILTINITPAAAGGVTVSPKGDYVSPNQRSFPAGTVVTMTAYFWLTVGQFDHWEGDASGTANPTTINMNSNKAVTAVFYIPEEAPTVQLTTGVVGSGSVLPSWGVYNPGDQIILAATPASGSVFVRWSGDIDGAIPVPGMPNNLQVTMDRDRHIVAEFEVSAPPPPPPPPPSGCLTLVILLLALVACVYSVFCCFSCQAEGVALCVY